MTAPQIITEDEWAETYRPMPAASGDGGFDFGDGPTLLDWTQPADLALIKAAEEDRIWTVVDGDGGLVIVAGHHFVNRMGYIVTENPRENDDIEVEMDD